MRFYLDASVALAAVLPGPGRAARVFIDEVTSAGGAVVSSTLLELEMRRALRREALDPAMADQVLDRISLVSVDDGLLRVAGAIEPHVKSLDAIHLATCALLGAITLVTHDRGMRQAAIAMGIDTRDPLGDTSV